MRVLIVNTSDKTGGAAIAAHRLMQALNNNGVKARMMVGEKLTDDIAVSKIPNVERLRWHFLWERLVIFCNNLFSRKHLFEIDIANSGSDITKAREFREADIIHLHWINQGLVSLKGLQKILQSGKPVVWTMHDMWACTGICHYSHGCEHYHEACGQCRLLRFPGAKDLSYRVFRRKRQIMSGASLNVVACSKWLAVEAEKSSLLTGQSVVNIPNPIDTRVFCPGDRREAARSVGLPSDKHIILFACQRATNPIKGMNYLVQACQLLAEQHPELKETTAVAILGGHSDEVTEQLPFAAFPLGYVSDAGRIVQVYRSADVYVLPSLSDNLPNTIMEAMACGVPCVGFKVGGIPEMIDHRKNGYVANFRDAADLAKGLYWVLHEADTARMSGEAVHKVNVSYSQTAVASRYIEVYNQALAFKHLEDI